MKLFLAGILYTVFILAVCIYSSLYLCNEYFNTGAYKESLINLIANPRKFDGKRVIVVGYMRDFNLYLTDIHERINDNDSSISIVDSEMERIISACSERYVRIDATFYPYKGGLRDVEEVEDIARGDDCWRRINKGHP